MKKASRIASESNDGILTLSNRVSSIFSGGVAVVNTDVHPGPGYLLACVEAAAVLDTLMEPSCDEMKSLLLLSRTLGGLPIVNYAGFCLRGHSDCLSTSVSMIATVFAMDPKLYAVLSRLLKLDANQNKDLSMLIKDPFSLTIQSPPQAESKIRKVIREGLEGTVRNELIES